MHDFVVFCFLRPVKSYLSLLGLLPLSLWAQFSFGVASGDPQPESVVLWTALEAVTQPQTVVWELSNEPDFTRILTSGSTTTSQDLGGTVKVIAGGLEAGQTYYYRFWWDQHVSPVGRTRTAPHPHSTQAVRLGVVSCAHFEAGYFYAYGALASEENLDAVVHLGDYIYEYGRWEAPWKVVDRLHEPAHEIVTLTDYRTRYAQYRRDPNLQALHAAHPMIAIWDDHEIANNSYETGAQNHQPDEGSYAERRAAAMQAYREWMPIRPASEKGYRAVKFGAMVDLLMIETRLDGRTEAVSKEAERHRPADRHHMMGVEQADWLREQLKHSSATYRVLGNQVIFTELNLGILPSDRLDRYNLDAWDGYASERDALTAEFAQVAPVVILTGDSHCSWAFEGTGYVELCAPSVTSTNFNEFALEPVARLAGALLWASNRPLEYVDTRNHGYMLVDFEAREARSTWVYVRDIKSPGRWRVHHRRHRRILPWKSNMLRR